MEDRSFHLSFRHFTDSGTCMEEFNQAYQQVVDGRLNHIIVVLLQQPVHNGLPSELDTYLKTHSYIDALKMPLDIDGIRKKIRFAMPRTPLKILKVCI